MFNMLKTAVLMAAITALFMLIGQLLGGRAGMMLALVIALGMNFFSYWFSDTMVLKMYRAREVDAANSPQFYRLVQELAALLEGRADWIWKFSPDQFDALGRMPNLRAMREESMRVEFIQMDAGGRTGADNPLTKDKVRQAVAHAVDRPTMAKQLMQGDSRAIDTPCYPTQFGCDASAAVHYPYDPAKAKQLLVEAGYPNGFDTGLVTPSLPQWSGAVQAT